MFDASAIVSASLKTDSVPELALLHARQTNVLALSMAVDAEIAEVLARLKFASVIKTDRRFFILKLIRDAAIWFVPTQRIADCRDPTDNKYPELALAADAEIIVSGDEDLLVLHPWRGVRILRPASYLEIAGEGA